MWFLPVKFWLATHPKCLTECHPKLWKSWEFEIPRNNPIEEESGLLPNRLQDGIQSINDLNSHHYQFLPAMFDSFGKLGNTKTFKEYPPIYQLQHLKLLKHQQKPNTESVTSSINQISNGCSKHPTLQNQNTIGLGQTIYWNEIINRHHRNAFWERAK